MRLFISAAAIAAGIISAAGFSSAAPGAGSAAPSATTPAASGKTADPGDRAAPRIAADTGTVPVGTLRIPYAGAMREWRVRLDELHCFPAEGTDFAWPVEPQSDEAALIREARRLEMENGGRYDLVLRETGSARRCVLTRRVMVEMTDGAVPAELARLADALSTKIPAYSPRHLILTCKAHADAPAVAALLRTQPGVVLAEPILAAQKARRLIPDDPRFAWSAGNPSYQWHLRNTGQNTGTAGIDINAAAVWDTWKGTGIRIGIVDDGLEVTHPDLQPAADTAIDHDWNDGTPDDPTGSATNDKHGTSCAGLAGARGNNGIGVTGTAMNATLVGLRLIAGVVGDDDEAEAISWRNDVIQIYSNSWGPDDDAADLENGGPLFRAAVQSSLTTGRGGRGNIYTWAAGNGGDVSDRSDYDGYASLPGTISVAALNDAGVRSAYSEEGSCVVVCAPSNDTVGQHQGIVTTNTQGGYTAGFGGTSAATPIAAGVIALMLERNPLLGWRDVQEILIRSARKVDDTDTGWADNGAGFHFNHKYGAGLIDASAAVTLAGGWVNLAPAQSTQQPGGASVAVPDNSSAGVTRTLTFQAADAVRVEHARLRVQATHARRGDLEITLTAPSGMTSRLFSQHNADTHSGMDWTFLSVRHWGETSTGPWQVKVADRRSGTSGQLTGLTLELSGTPLTAPTQAPVITSALTLQGTQGAFLSYQITAVNSPAQFAAVGLPAGLSVNAAGLISGTPSVSGTFDAALSATNVIGTGQATLVLTLAPHVPAPPMITSPLESSAVTGQPWSYQITANGNPASFGAPDRPAWMTLNAATGLLSGTPPGAGTVNLTLSAVNGDGPGTAMLVLTIQSTASALSAAVDAPELSLTSASPSWTVVTAGTHDGIDAAASAQIGHNQSSYMTCQVTGPGMIVFRARVSSEEDYDFLSFLIDGVSQWAVSGETGWQLVSFPVAAGTHTLAWRYSKDVSELSGSDRGWVDEASFVSVNAALARGLDAPGFRWSAGGTGIWRLQDAATSDSADAVMSPPLAHNSASWIETLVMGPGSLSFKWLVSSQQDYDLLHFDIDGVPDESISGTPAAWIPYTAEIPAGVHAVRWRYIKNSTAVSGKDQGYVDQVSYVPHFELGAPYQQWLAAAFPADSLGNAYLTGPGEDPDQDGQTNMHEYAFRSNPLAADVAPVPTAVTLPSEIQFYWTIDTARSDVNISPQVSDNMVTWTGASSELVSVDGTLQTRRLRVSASSGRRFMRLTAVMP